MGCGLLYTCEWSETEVHAVLGVSVYSCAELPPGAVAVQLNEEEQAAVGRLEAMGFDRQAVLEAFLACDRNETMAANFLLENAGDDM